MNNLDQFTLLKAGAKIRLIQVVTWLGFKTLFFLPKHICQAEGHLISQSSLYYAIKLIGQKLLSGFNDKYKVSKEYFGATMAHWPAGGSLINILHWIQCYRSGTMRKFDYGVQKNKEIYGSETPHNYSLDHLKNLSFRSQLIKGEKDIFSNE